MSEVGYRGSITKNHSPLLSPILFISGLLFEGLVRLRNGLYDSGLHSQLELPQPVISIGNLTVGGSGKTPLVIHVARTLSRIGATPVLLSRGYGRAARAPVILPPRSNLVSPAPLLGDEPALARKHESDLWLGISRNRYAAGLQILKRAARSVFILDDGFQHRRLKRDLDIVVLDRTQPLTDNRMLPHGTLREPLVGLRRAAVVVINGLCASGGKDPLEGVIRSIHPNAAVFHCVQQIQCLMPFDEWQDRGTAGEPCKARPSAFLVAAIGNPERFRRDIQTFGVQIKGTRFYRDHFCPGQSDWLSCIEEARLVGAEALITTEKDAIKISKPLDFPLTVAIQSTRLVEQGELEQMLGAIIEGNR